MKWELSQNFAQYQLFLYNVLATIKILHHKFQMHSHLQVYCDMLPIDSSQHFAFLFNYKTGLLLHTSCHVSFRPYQLTQILRDQGRAKYENQKTLSNGKNHSIS